MVIQVVVVVVVVVVVLVVVVVVVVVVVLVVVSVDFQPKQATAQCTTNLHAQFAKHGVADCRWLPANRCWLLADCQSLPANAC